jgi:hypothetical protein
VPPPEGLLSLPQFLVFEGGLAPRSAVPDRFEPKLRVRLPKPGAVAANRVGLRRMQPLARFHPLYSGHVLARAVPLAEVPFPALVLQPRIDALRSEPKLAGRISLPSHLAAGAGELRMPPFLGLAWPVEIPPIHPRLRLLPKHPEVAQPTEELRPKRRNGLPMVSLPAGSRIQPWTPVVQFWQRAPRDLKLLAFALPLLAGLAVHPSLPKVSITAADRPAPISSDTVSKAVGGRLSTFKQEIANRAGVEFHDDFRAGLDDWQSKSDLHRSWSFDHAGFVRPGPLAIYAPTVPLTDYTFEFLGQLDRKSLSWAFRAQDFGNYYAQRLVVLQPGPLPVVGLQTWAVIGGKAGPKREVILPIVTRNEMLYRIKLDVRNENFTLSIQGQLVDFWSDGRLKSGGVGLFGSRGQESRVRWVQVSHQYDALGRLCAYLAPYSIQSADGSNEQ